MDNLFTNNSQNHNIKQYRFDSLSLASINVNSIVANVRRFNLINFVKKHNIDITLINETKLKENHRLYFEKYKLIRTDRISKNGGTAILLKEQIEFEQIFLDCQDKIKTIKFTIIRLRLKNNKALFIISMYSPGDVRRQFAEDLGLVFEELNLNNVDNFYILAGDLNSKHPDWLDDCANNKGLGLREWIKKMKWITGW